MKKWLLLLIIFLPAILTALALIVILRIAPYSHGSGRPEMQIPASKLNALQASLKAHVETFAVSIGERNSSEPEQLARAAQTIKDFWKAAGFDVRVQAFEENGARYENIWVEIPGRGKKEEIVVVGAHYDSAPGTAGADDNASGVAALLELSKMLKEEKTERTLRFVAFANEEPPLFMTDAMGSRVFARAMSEKKEKVSAMLSLESIGYFTQEPQSQKYPPLLDLIYPDRGNFIAVVGNFKNTALLKKVMKYFREATDLPSECIAAPESLAGVSWSDHAAFWEFGFPAVMITDTVPYRNPHYHQASDTPETLSYPDLAKAVFGLSNVLKKLSA